MNSIASCEGCNGSCCCYYIVPVTGYDAYVIAQTQLLSMDNFLMYIREEEPTSAGFVLDRTRQTHSLVLSKQYADEQRSPCIFLMHFPDGTQRCGVYAYRPLVCQAYPATLRNGSVDIREDAVCPAGSWNIAALHLPQWRERLMRMELETAVYRLVVSRWNAIVRDSRSEREYTILDYFAYLMNVYYRIQRLWAQLSIDTQRQIVGTLGRRLDMEPLFEGGSSSEGSLMTATGYLRRVNHLLSGVAAYTQGPTPSPIRAA
jgi:Fe-S-cluster containining protein